MSGLESRLKKFPYSVTFISRDQKYDLRTYQVFLQKIIKEFGNPYNVSIVSDINEARTWCWRFTKNYTGLKLRFKNETDAMFAKVKFSGVL
jgi:hypothetical protein